MNISDFSWSVLASIVAGLILGGVTYKIIKKNIIKTKDTIIQVGDKNQAANKSKNNTFGSNKDD